MQTGNGEEWKRTGEGTSGPEYILSINSHYYTLYICYKYKFQMFPAMDMTLTAMQMLSEEQLDELLRRVRQHGQEADDQLEGVFDDAEPPTPSRSRTARGGKAETSTLKSTAKTARRRHAALKASSSSPDKSDNAGPPQVRMTSDLSLSSL